MYTAEVGIGKMRVPEYKLPISVSRSLGLTSINSKIKTTPIVKRTETQRIRIQKPAIILMVRGTNITTPEQIAQDISVGSSTTL